MSPFGPRKQGSSAILDRTVFRLASLCIVLMLAVGALIISVVVLAQARSACDAWRLVATLPITDKSTPTGLNLVVAGRKAYIGLGCHPSLPPVDPRVRPYLVPGSH